MQRSAWASGYEELEARARDRGVCDTVYCQLTAQKDLSKDTHDITADTLLIDGKCLHGKLHSVEAGGFPYKICGEALSNLVWYTFRPTQLKTNFI